MFFGIDFRGIHKLGVASGCLWHRSATFASKRNISAGGWIKGGNDIPVDKPFPGADHFVDCRPLVRVRRPTLLDELPHLRTKSKLFGSLGFGRPLPTSDLDNDRLVPHIPERNLSAEHFHSQHREREDVGGLGCRGGARAGFGGWIDDLRSEPS